MAKRKRKAAAKTIEPQDTNAAVDQVDQAKPPAETESRGRGRPKGAKTYARATIVHTSARCPKCGSTDLEPPRGAQTFALSGKLGELDGKRYTHFETRRSRCFNCRMRVRIVTYYNGERSGNHKRTNDAA